MPEQQDESLPRELLGVFNAWLESVMLQQRQGAVNIEAFSLDRGINVARESRNTSRDGGDAPDNHGRPGKLPECLLQGEQS
jgi:hypothetical protein